MTTILVVDDEPLVRAIIDDILREEGFNVLTATNGRAMLQTLETVTPALILLDVMMPVLNGFAALQALREHPRLRAIPVVMMSAGMNLATIQDLSLEILPKPFEIEQFLELVWRIVRPQDDQVG